MQSSLTKTTRRLLVATLLAASALLQACAYMKETQVEIPAEMIAAKSPGKKQKIVVVLPGIGDTLGGMRRTGIADVIQSKMPDADVLLVEFTMPYYIKTQGSQRLHDEIVQPLRIKGYRDIYMAGASLGGMGALMFEREHPNELDGLILMSPYMGPSAMIAEIKNAGGIERWQPGPIPASINGDTAPRENWRLIKSWINDTKRTQQVWLICGEDDKFYPAAEIIASILPRKNYVTLEGGHTWKVWTKGAATAFAAIEDEQAPGLAKD